MRFFVFAAAAGFAALALADARSEFQAHLNAEIPKVEQAFAKEDMKFFENVCTPDFTMIQMGQKTNKKESLAGLKQMFDMSSNIKAKIKCTIVKVTDKAATITTVGTYSMDTVGPDKKKHKMTMTETATEHFVKTPKGWKLRQIVTTKAPKATMDGKPFDPMLMAPPSGPPPKVNKPKGG